MYVLLTGFYYHVPYLETKSMLHPTYPSWLDNLNTTTHPLNFRIFTMEWSSRPVADDVEVPSVDPPSTEKSRGHVRPL